MASQKLLIASAGYPLLLIPLIVKRRGSSQSDIFLLKIKGWRFLLERTVLVIFNLEYSQTLGLNKSNFYKNQ